MDLNKIALFGMMTEKLHWLQKRQRVLSENVANADTPGYMARDLEKPSFQDFLGARGVSTPALKRTSAAHLSARSGASDFTVIEAPGPSASPNGNTVDLPTQMMKMGEVQMDYSTTIGLYRKHVNMIRAVLGRGN